MKDLDKRIDEILYDYWARHRDCKNGCQSTDFEGEGTKQYILDLIKEVVEEVISGERGATLGYSGDIKAFGDGIIEFQKLQKQSLERILK